MEMTFWKSVAVYLGRCIIKCIITNVFELCVTTPNNVWWTSLKNSSLMTYITKSDWYGVPVVFLVSVRYFLVVVYENYQKISWEYKNTRIWSCHSRHNTLSVCSSSLNVIRPSKSTHMMLLFKVVTKFRNLVYL